VSQRFNSIFPLQYLYFVVAPGHNYIKNVVRMPSRFYCQMPVNFSGAFICYK